LADVAISGSNATEEVSYLRDCFTNQMVRNDCAFCLLPFSTLFISLPMLKSSSLKSVTELPNTQKTVNQNKSFSAQLCVKVFSQKRAPP